VATRDTGRISALVERAVRAEGFDLEQVTVRRVGARDVVVVVIDRDDGVDLAAVATATRAVSAALDAEDPLPGAYVLEVTSPGVDRPLRTPTHWRRARGRLVKVSGPALRVTGRVLSCDDAGVDLDIAGVRRTIAYPEITSASVQVEFSRPGGTAEGGELA
jgi:ribosome maturation factor RimP